MLGKVIGENIRSIRKQKGLSQKDAALRAGFTSSYWGYIERGLRNPSVELIEQIARSLDVEAHLLLMASPGEKVSPELMQLIHAAINLGPRHIEFIITVLKAYVDTHKE